MRGLAKTTLSKRASIPLQFQNLVQQLQPHNSLFDVFLTVDLFKNKIIYLTHEYDFAMFYINNEYKYPTFSDVLKGNFKNEVFLFPYQPFELPKQKKDNDSDDYNTMVASRDYANRNAYEDVRPFNIVF
jgi:hypothetical protein